ncbi:MAG: hypothetical protein U5M50_16050 [Sphingobium sp.]|nr:hypothetical protein [Sphingobium sp.]
MMAARNERTQVNHELGGHRPARGGAPRERLQAAGALMLGPRPHEQLVGYLQHAHVGIVPFSFIEAQQA